MATPLESWVEEQARLTKPDRIHWCDGSSEDVNRILEIGQKEEKLNGPVFHKLNHQIWPGAYLHRSHPTDVARTEHLTFVCHSDRDTTGPNNNWKSPEEARELCTALSEGCMRGRTMYVLPYMMGHPDSPYAKACVQLTDTSYVAVSMGIMTRLGTQARDTIGATDNFVKGIHSIGDLDPSRRYIMHFPDEHLVWSIGSGYGGNALLGKKCFSLRIASWLGRQEGWLAEHMVIMGIEDPQGKVTYVTAALPSACGKTNLAMLESALPGYKVWTLGDDIAWLNVGPDGRLWAINPEAGFFGVAPGTSAKTNPRMLDTLKGKRGPILFTNTALDVTNNTPWWEGLDGPVPAELLDWQGHPWNPGMGTKGAHPNSRFTTSLYNAPTLSPEYDNPKGVPISAMLLGGRRSRLIPLITEAFSWQHGVFLGARTGSETTAAASGKVGVLRRDPMAMLPFCGYNMGDYFQHWLSVGNRCTSPPRIYSINWFRSDESGNIMWPGFGDNIRVLKWVVDRVNGRVGARETPIGLLPHARDLNLEGLDLAPERVDKLFEINPAEWRQELDEIEAFLNQFGDRLAPGVREEYESLRRSLSSQP